jgi:TPR repeat protein
MLAGAILEERPPLALPGETAQAYFDTALPVLRAQAAKGDRRAQFALGLAKLGGHGQPKDPEGGFLMLLQVERQGLEPMQALQMMSLRTRLPAEVVHRAEQSFNSKQTAPFPPG